MTLASAQLGDLFSGSLLILCTGLPWSLTGGVLSLATRKRLDAPTMLAVQTLMSLTLSCAVLVRPGQVSQLANPWLLVGIMLAAVPARRNVSRIDLHRMFPRRLHECDSGRLPIATGPAIILVLGLGTGRHGYRSCL